MVFFGGLGGDGDFSGLAALPAPLGCGGCGAGDGGCGDGGGEAVSPTAFFEPPPFCRLGEGDDVVEGEGEGEGDGEGEGEGLLGTGPSHGGGT